VEEFKFIVTVDTATLEQAHQVMRERIENEEDYGFSYLIDWI
jgi:2-oxo-4-hydroxy-4-carboxy--5-ureidoimidazoline (OHCU) decarboxylase